VRQEPDIAVVIGVLIGIVCALVLLRIVGIL
jgi:hypothetical protein